MTWRKFWIAAAVLIASLGGVAQPIYLLPSNNLSDLPNKVTAAADLGLGAASSPTFAGVTITGTVTADHFVGSGTAPTVAVGSGAGGGATASIAGADASMQVTLNTGSSTTINSTVLTVTFGTSFASAPYPTFSPVNQPAALITGDSNAALTITATTTGFTMQVTGGGKLANNTTYILNIKT